MEDWRFKELRRLGLTAYQAERLRHRPDVAHTVRAYIDDGCSPALAYRLLRY